MEKLKHYLNYYPIYILIILIFGVFLYWRSSTHYLDISSFCSISIDKDFLRGNRETIQKALLAIKQNDSGSYKLICRNVDRIAEDLCPNDHTYGGPWELIRPGCFIKGTRIIYIEPSPDKSKGTILERAEAIKSSVILLNQYLHSGKTP